MVERVPSGASPDDARTSPFASVVAVAYQRRSVMSAPRVHVCVIGSNSDVMLWPLWGEPTWPPTTITRPSARVAWPAQWRSAKVAGASVNVPVVGSQTRALSPVDQTRTLPVDSWIMCLAWTPQSRSGPHSPLSEGASARVACAEGGGATAVSGVVASCVPLVVPAPALVAVTTGVQRELASTTAMAAAARALTRRWDMM